MWGAPKSILEAADEAWQLDTWSWCFRSFGESDFRGRDLVLFTPDRFKSLKGVKTANPGWLLDDVKRITGVSAPQVVIWDPDAPEEEEPPEDQIVVSYSDAELQNPWPLILRCAISIAEARVRDVDEDAPGGDAMYDCTYEVVAAYLGFGLFGADCAIRRTYVPGWRGRRMSEDKNTALREPDWSFAIAVFLHLKGGAIDPLLPYLNEDLVAPLRQALRYLESKPELAKRLIAGA